MVQNHRKPPKQAPTASKPRNGLGLLRFKADGSQVTIQHANNGVSGDGGKGSRGATVPTLRIDLKSSKVWSGMAAPLPADASSLTLGVAGMLRLERGSILVLITKGKRVCTLPDGAVYKVEDTSLVAHEAINACENDLKYASLLQEALNPKCFGSHLYFSHTANITASRQMQAAKEGCSPATPPAGGAQEGGGAAETSGGGGGGGDGRGGFLPSLGAWWDSPQESGSDGSDGGDHVEQRADTGAGGAAAGAAAPSGRGAAAGGAAGAKGGGGTLWARADPRFTWNRELMQPLIEAGGEAFALPIMAGYIGQATGATFQLRTQRPPQPSHRDSAPAEGGDTDAAVGSSGGAPADADTGAAGAGNAGAAAAAAGAAVPGDLTLITRLGTERPVAGGWRRGADRHGHAAGFAETELILALQQELGPAPQEGGRSSERGQESTLPGEAASEGSEQQQRREQPESQSSGAPQSTRTRSRVAVASYVMARGSAPLFWAAPPDMSPCPAPRGPEEAGMHAVPFVQHVASLHRAYGRRLLLLNLIHGANQGRQLRLHDTLQKQVAEQRTPSGPGSGASTAATTAATAVVGLPLSARQLPELASCGPAAAALERECAEELRAIRAFVSLDEVEVTVRQEPPPSASSDADSGAGGSNGACSSTQTNGESGGGGGSKDAGSSTNNGGDSGGGGGGSSSSGTTRRSYACLGRRVHCWQEGVVRVSSGSAASAGGACEEVDLAQHALALPVLSEMLSAVGALDDPADLAAAHASVMHALAQLWSNMADVLADQAHGTSSDAGRALRAAAERLEGPACGGGGLLVHRAKAAVLNRWRAIVAKGDRVSRYYYSNFTDARRQDALDLSSGAFKMTSPPPPLPRRQPPNTTSLQLGILLLLAALVQAALCAYQDITSLTDLGTRVAAPLVLGLTLLADVVRRGRSYVEQPLLLPGAVYPWAD